MSSSSSRSPRRHRKHSRNTNKSARKMVINEEPSSPESPFSWRLIRSEDKGSNSGSSSKSTRKSNGIPPSQFHAKKNPLKNNTDNDGNCNDNNKINEESSSVVDATPRLPLWKEQAERNLLLKEHKTHANKLETKRKNFRRKTQLKTWPLQDMAMEHLDHLLGINANNQFHGGDYVSSESSSSISSVESSKPRLALSTKRIAKSYLPDTNEKVDRNSSENNEDEQQNKKDIDSNVIIKGEIDDGVTTIEQQTQSPLWSLEPRIFATEKANGKRKYLVGQFGRIADWYWRKTAPSSRHLYEVIREGSPCRLYFDLEFSRVHNPSVPAKQLLRELEDELAIELQTYYGKSVSKLRSSQIVNLDSSNDSKFSRHWIVHLLQEVVEKEPSSSASLHIQRREMLFRDAPTVGRFIKRMVGRLADELAVIGGDFAEKRPALAKHLFVNTKDPAKQTCFIDLGVYTRNRLLRCLESSKFGKTMTLQAVLHEKVEEQDQIENNDHTNNDDAAYITCTEDDDNCTERQYFPLKLPSKKEVSSSQSSILLSINDFVLANNWEPHARALADSLVVPLTESISSTSILSSSSSSSTNPKDIDQIHILEVDDKSGTGGYTGTSSTVGTRTTTGSTGSQRKFAPSISMSRQGSPLPSLDQFVVECLGTRGPMCIRGSIRAWSIEYGPRETPISFTYQMQRNRFCELVGRSHKSNNIFWTIDLNSWICIQGCHDPECFGRGSPIPILNYDRLSGKGGRLDSIKQEFETWQEEEFEKALMALNLDDINVNKEKSSSSQLNPNGKVVADENNHDSHKKNDDERESGGMDTLSDDALLQACLDNPELFP